MRLVVKKQLRRSLKFLIYRSAHLVNCIFFFFSFCFWNHLLKNKHQPKAETEDAFSNAKCTWAFRSSIHNRGKEEIWEIHKCQNASVVPHIPQCFETQKSLILHWKNHFRSIFEAFENLTISREWIWFWTKKNETFLNEFQTTVFSVSSFENVAMVLHTFWRLTLDAELKCIAELIACHRVRIHMGPLDHRSKILTLLNVHPSFPWINCLLCIAMQASFQNRDNADSTYGSASIDLSLAT